MVLDMLPAAAEIGLNMGVFLQEFGAAHEENRSSWRAWDDPFKTCLQIDELLGWKLREPEIHHMRWLYFSELDLPTALVHLRQKYLSMKNAAFPEEEILRSHIELAAHINNVGHTPQEKRWSAELHEIWARELAQLEASQPLPRYKHILEFEQSYNLIFASQAMRHITDYGRAMRC